MKQYLDWKLTCVSYIIQNSLHESKSFFTTFFHFILHLNVLIHCDMIVIFF